MEARAHASVPEFGNWDAQGQIPYTSVFDNARAGKGGNSKFNPNDPAENPAAFGLKANDAPPTGPFSKPQPDGGSIGSVQSKHNGEEGWYISDAPKKASSASGTRKNRVDEESPNHPVYQGRLGNRPGSPYCERKTSAEGGSAHGSSTPGRSRLRGSVRADETPDRGAAIPKFGEWNVNDPSAGEGFTMIFNQHRNEKKQGGPAIIPSQQGGSSHSNGYKQGSILHQQKKSSFWSCFLGTSATD
ncbi:hypothetical protein KP509_03G042100 [Ceratopteris richardii]|uniref:RIN4 pathogenic type III effector avirulence factor Avr cleavage site domain-containing protein n=1 Tax=Ceratopteris richardii TaxID=49495 RepID=A0A8T2V6L2_CERRI|nr:hypothetical protein KP509_03G042100 [Ceratopteris richardii]